MLSDFIKAMKWRYAVKIFNTKKKLAVADFKGLLEAMRLSPSSLGLQPYRVVIVKNKAARQLIFDTANNQRKVLEAPYLLIFCTPLKFTQKLVDSFINRFRDERHMTEAEVKNLRTARRKFFAESDFETLDRWAGEQAFIALGVLISAAASSRIDAGPMGGFKPEVLDKVLNLKKYNLRSRVMCALGYRSESDPEAEQPKVRRSLDELTVVIE